MSVVLGTNAGFVTTAPVADPSGSNIAQDGAARATKHVCPADVNTVTEAGWWHDSVSSGLTWEIGLYSHDGVADEPDALLYSSTGHTTDGTIDWQVASGLDWAVTPGTTYWVAVQLQASGTINTNYNSSGGRTCIDVGALSLTDPFVVDGTTAYIMAFYALVEAGVTYSELSGTIAATTTVSGDLELVTYSALSGTIAATSTTNTPSLGQVAVSVSEIQATRRLVAVGNSRVYYETVA